MEINKRDSICLEKTTFLVFPGFTDIRNHEVKSDNRITESFRSCFKKNLIVWVSAFKFFESITSVAQAYFFAQSDDLSFFWDIFMKKTFIPMFFVSDFPSIFSVFSRKWSLSIPSKLTLDVPIHLFVKSDFSDSFFSCCIFFFNKLFEVTFSITYDFWLFS